ncbi:unnamed protein product [Echinostoma caproni]|uniref:DUF1752 domain-containing protein n=1 Tax=Echinostoma caproni TaxID=27848 RepID=A0A183A0V0_9TREM|nr:unnamed protein product [Echinostoma caproni]
MESPNSRSGSRDRSVTPPHWRQASQNTQRMDNDGWRAWHEQRAFQRMNMPRDDEPRSPRLSPSKADRRLDSSPSAAAASARNRSPSESPSRRQSSVTEPRDVSRGFGGRNQPSPNLRHQDTRLPSPTLKSRYVAPASDISNAVL